MTTYTWAAAIQDRSLGADPHNIWLDKLHGLYTHTDAELYKTPWPEIGHVVFSNGIWDPVGLRAKLEQGAKDAWDLLASDNQTKVSVGAVNVYDGQLHSFDLAAMTKDGVVAALPCYREAILASSAIPLAFPPRFIDGEPYYDGGIEFLVYLDAVFDSLARSAALAGAETRHVNIRIIVKGNQSPNDPGNDASIALACDEAKVGVRPTCARVANSHLGLTGGGKGLILRTTQDIMVYQLKKDSLFRIYNDWRDLIESSRGKIDGTFKVTYIPNAQLVNPAQVGGPDKPCTKTTGQAFDLGFQSCLYEIGLAKGRAGKWEFQDTLPHSN
jgi:hypothetical protein